MNATGVYVGRVAPETIDGRDDNERMLISSYVILMAYICGVQTGWGNRCVCCADQNSNALRANA